MIFRVYSGFLRFSDFRILAGRVFICDKDCCKEDWEVWEG
jgi:hypothetical protein